MAIPVLEDAVDWPVRADTPADSDGGLMPPPAPVEGAEETVLLAPEEGVT